MRRQLPDYVQKLLLNYNEPETQLYVLGKGISLRNWVIFCAAEGALDGRRHKLREIAEVEKVSVPRVSAILKNVRNRILGNEVGRTELGLLRDYRAGRYGALKYVSIVNAKTVGSIVQRFWTGASWISSCWIGPRCPGADRLDWDCHVSFLADGKSLQIEKSSIWGRYWSDEHIEKSSIWGRNWPDEGYMVLWAKDGAGNTNNTASDTFRDIFRYRPSGNAKYVLDALLLVDYNGAFWVEDRVEFFREEKRLVVYLKPAECSKKST